MFLKPWFLLGTPGLCSRGAWQRYMFLAMLRGMILPTEPQNVCGVRGNVFPPVVKTF